MNRLEDQTYYQLLGISKSASVTEIKRAYRRLAKKYHPDANKEALDADERFKEITEAYEVLSDEHKKMEYDQLLKPPPKNYSRQYQAGYSSSGYSRTERYSHKTGKRPKYKKRKSKSLSDIFFRAAIYSLLFIFLIAVAAYLFRDDRVKLNDRSYLQTEDNYQGLAGLEDPKLSAKQPAQDQLGDVKENLRKELLLELREKEEQNWREQWTDNDRRSLRRKFQQRRMVETYEMRNRLQAEQKLPNRNDDPTDYEDNFFEY